MITLASLLPAATEWVCALGLEARLVAVTFECDHPPGVEAKPKVVTTTLPGGLSSGDIDAVVREHARRGESLYRIEAETLERLRPDVLVNQTLCDVCAASRPDLDRALGALSYRPRVVTLNGVRLDEVLGDARRLAAELAVSERGEGLVRELRGRLASLRRRLHDALRPRVVLLEWLDPPMACGHWIPDMVAAAGGREVLGIAGRHSRRVTWDEVAAARPDVLVLTPCGYDVETAVRDAAGAPWDTFASTPAVATGRVYCVDGGAHFSRAGPRLVEGVETLARLLHPDRAPDAHPGMWRRTAAIAPVREPIRTTGL